MEKQPLNRGEENGKKKGVTVAEKKG